jgi:uncharacterized protein YajQ (UPF0234 family)
MPTFDIVSEVDHHELTNALDQASREIGTRFDFKGVPASFELKDNVITMTAEVEFQLDQMMEILKGKMIKRQIELSSLKPGDVELVGKKAIQKVTVQQGIEPEIARKIVKHVKDLKLKVQIAIQGEKLRVTGKKRDDLQEVMAVLRQGEFGLPLQYAALSDVSSRCPRLPAVFSVASMPGLQGERQVHHYSSGPGTRAVLSRWVNF